MFLVGWRPQNRMNWSWPIVPMPADMLASYEQGKVHVLCRLVLHSAYESFPLKLDGIKLSLAPANNNIKPCGF